MMPHHASSVHHTNIYAKQNRITDPATQWYFQVVLYVILGDYRRIVILYDFVWGWAP